jgi:hypothetical protein
MATQKPAEAGTQSGNSSFEFPLKRDEIKFSGLAKVLPSDAGRLKAGLKTKGFMF